MVPAAVTILYDADCGFCRWMVALLLSWDRAGRLRVASLQDPEADALLAGMGEAERIASAHVVLEDGTVVSGGPAFAWVAALLRGGRPLAAVARALGDRAMERLYRFVADRRDVFGPVVPARWKRWADGVIARRRARQAPVRATASKS
jgi:predicted DCC family thiol-disulfide oxidoreductase YuxK